MANSYPKPDELALLVEGEDDKHVVLQLCIRIGFQPQFRIIDKGGIDNVLSGLSPEIKAEGRKAVGILVDANDDLNGRWKSLSDKLREVGIELPSSPEPAGTIIDGMPRVGLWLMPDNQSAGELEDFVQTMIPAGDPVWPRSQRYVDDIPTEHRKFQQGKTLRAQVYAWLATREIPGRMGAAIEAKDLNINALRCIEFVDWLHKLFR